MTTSFERVLNEVNENYKLRADKIQQLAQQGKATSRSELNAFIGENAQITLVSNIRFHLRKGLVSNGSEMEEFLKRTKAGVLRDKREGYAAIIALCDKLLVTVSADMKWDKP